MTYKELVQKENKTDLEYLLMQCIAELSSHPQYIELSPEEIFDSMVKRLETIQEKMDAMQ